MAAWLTEVFSHPDLPTLLAIVAKTAILYVALVAGMRLLGQHQLGELSVQDFVLLAVVANSVQNALVQGDDTLAGGLASAITLLAMNRAYTSLLMRFPWLERRLVGEPVVLVERGRVMWARLRREGLTRDELLAALREHGIADLDDVQLAVLEVDGTISAVPRDAAVHRTRHHVRALKV